MQIQKTIIDDFKTDRKDILPPLPLTGRLVPILFYASVFAAIVLSAIFALQLKISKGRIESLRQELSETQKRAADTKSERAALEERILRANEVEAWVEGSRPLQPLIIAITRSIQEGSSIQDMRLTRREDTPEQLHLSISIGTDSIAQLDRVLDAIHNQGYREISPQQTVNRGQIDYQATLVRQSTNGPTPETEPQSEGQEKS